MDETDHLTVGFGTYRLTGQTCIDTVNLAIEAGYQMFDTATYYKNFREIGKAFQGHNRSLYYLTSKVWHDSQTPSGIHKDIEMTLKQLQMDYLDAYLVHWPNSKIPIEETLGTMDTLRHQGKIRHIGLCNVTAGHLKRALEVGIPITWVQNEMSPFFYDPDVLEFCKERGIRIQAWAPLGVGRIKEDPLLASIGNSHGKSSAQIAIRWILQHGVIPLPSSTKERHIRENRDVMDFTLSKGEMQEIDQRAKQGERKRASKQKHGFDDEFDLTYTQCWPKKHQIGDKLGS